MKAIILAAGYGTRLGGASSEGTSKCLLEVGKNRIIDIIVEKVVHVQAVDEIVVVTNDEFYSEFVKWQSEYSALSGPDKVQIVSDGTTSNENRLGSLGDLCYVLDKYEIDEGVLVIAGDNLFEPGLEGIVETAIRRRSSVVGVYDFHDTELVRGKYGVVEIDSDGRVVGFQEKPGDPRSSIAATALYYFQESDIPHIRALNSRPHDKEVNVGEIFVELMSESVPVYVYFLDKWFDIGTPADLEAARNHASGLDERDS